MSWRESVDRVLQMRRVAQLEREKDELIAILQELEKRCQVVVNRQVSAVLKDVPTWKDVKRSDYPGQRVQTFRGGMRTWKERRLQLEKKHRVEADKVNRRVEEFRQVMSGQFGEERVSGRKVRIEPPPGSLRSSSRVPFDMDGGINSAQAGAPAVQEQKEESSDVEHST